MRAATLIALAMTALSTASCAKIAGLDDFEKRTVSESAATASEYFALKLSLVAMKPHMNHSFEYRVVDANNFIQSRGVIRAMTAEDVTLLAQRAIPRANGPYRLDFYNDVNHSGGFDGLGSVVSNDHAWRIEPLVENPDALRNDDVVAVNFVHNTSFTNIDQYPSGTKNPALDTGLDAKIHLAGLGAFAGRIVELRVAEKRTRHVVALYHIMRTDEVELDAIVPGCVDLETEYDLDVWADANANGQYDDPSSGAGDKGWRFSATSTDKGLEASIDLASSAIGDGTVDVGHP